MEDHGIVTACTMDCPDACSLIVSRAADGRHSIKGNPDHPATKGFTCAKVHNHFKRLSSPDRIIYPMRRTPTGWERIEWETALQLCAEKIQVYRLEPASILYFHGEGAKGVLKQAGHLFLTLLEATRVRGSFCDSAGYSACMKDFGSRETSDIETLLDARSIVNWGKDLSRSSVHMASLVQKARQRGAEVLSLSPGCDLNNSLSDFQICIRPGTDRFLACAVIRLFIERGAISKEMLSHTGNWDEFQRHVLEQDMDDLLHTCCVDREDAERVYDFYEQMHPAATIIGAGVQRYSFGGENVRFINALAMISGNIGIRGGGSHFHMNSLRNLNLTWTQAAQSQKTRFLRMPLIGQEIAEAKSPPIRMAWVDGSNMVNQAPGSRQTAEAFEKIEFTVVVDAFMTDTASRADLVLPSTLMLEQEDIVASFMHDYVQYVRPVLEPPGEARDDFQILTDLGARLDPPIVLPDAEICMRESLKSPYLGITIEELKKRGFARAKRPSVAYEGLYFDHPDHKYRFPTELHDEQGPPDGYPLRLLSLVRRDIIHSQFLPEDQKMPPKVWVSPDCPVLTEIDRSRSVSLVSPLARLRVFLETLVGLHPEVVLYRRGDWMKLGGGINQLIAPGLTDMGTGTVYYDQYVRLEND
jgi:anaerobic selenocysteine-containing dehydrogenase